MKLRQYIAKTSISLMPLISGCYNPFNLFPPKNNLVGRWKERESIPCDKITTRKAENFDELIFNNNNTFSFTNFAFETYRDYWGTYAFDQNTSNIKLNIVDGNYVPADADLEGSIQFNDGGNSAKLDRIYFGTFNNEGKKDTCGYIIEKY